MGTDESARMRRVLAVAEARRDWDDAKAVIRRERDDAWHGAIAESIDRVRDAMTGVTLGVGGTLLGSEVLVRNAMRTLAGEVERMSVVLAEIQDQSQAEWDRAKAARDRALAAFDFEAVAA